MFFRIALFFIYSLLLGLLSACAPLESVNTDQPNQPIAKKNESLTSNISLLKPDNLPENALIKGIPYYPDTRNFFAPSTLASVLNYYNTNVSVTKLLPRTYITAQKGTLEFDTILNARKFGFVVYPLTEDIQDIFLEISQNHPVVVTLKNPDNPDDWSFHTIYGYDFNDKTITLTDISRNSKKLSMDEFDREWSQSQHWAVTITPPNLIPASAREIGYLTAISRIEPIAPIAAKDAYIKTLERWPNNIVALIGIGDIAYVHKDYKEALDYFQKAVKVNPSSGDALNNLAETYMALHQPQMALTTIQKAVKLKSHHHRTYLMTQRRIESYLRKHNQK